MAASISDGALLSVKKLGGVALILFGIIGIAVGLEYRTTEFSAPATGADIVALALGAGLLALNADHVSGPPEMLGENGFVLPQSNSERKFLQPN